MSITDADRAKAMEVWRAADEVNPYLTSGKDALIEGIAAALADEREKARAPFVKICKDFEVVIPTMDWSHQAPAAGVLDSVVQVLRRAIEGGKQ